MIESLESRLLFAAASFDTSFNSTGVAAAETPIAASLSSPRIRSDGKFFALSSTGDQALLRFTSAGLLDATFGDAGRLSVKRFATFTTARAVAYQADGKVVVIGHNDAPVAGFQAVRLSADGVVDTTFGISGTRTVPVPGLETAEVIPGGGGLEYLRGNGVTGATIDSLGRIIVTGNAGANSDAFVARLTAAGAVDISFSGDGVASYVMSGAPETISPLAQSDNKIVVAAGGAVIRYNVDGSQDLTFGQGSAAGGQLGAPGKATYGFRATQDSAGRLLVLGYYGGFGPSRMEIGRFDRNGQLDTTYATAGVATLYTNSFATDAPSAGAADLTLDAAGRVVLGGFSRGVAGQSVVIVRFAADGKSLDTTFSTDGVAVPNTGPAGGFGLGVVTDSANRVIVVGRTSADYNAPLHSMLITRVTAAGVADATFGTGGSGTTIVAPLNRSDDAPVAFARQADGKLLVLSRWTNRSIDASGSYYAYGGLTRFNVNGTLDTAFGVGGTISLGGSPLALAATTLGPVVVTSQPELFSRTLYRFRLSDGGLDTSFSTDGIVSLSSSSRPISLAGDAQGRVYLWDNTGYLNRLNASGVSEYFSTLSTSNATAATQGLAVTAAGDLLLAGGSTMWLYRTAVGATDQDFGSHGSLNVGTISAFAAASDGSFVTAAPASLAANQPGLEFRRYSAAGVADTSYGTGGVARVDAYPGTTVETPTGLALYGDGVAVATTRLVPAAGGASPASAVVQLTATGQPDAAFDGDGLLVLPAPAQPLLDAGVMLDDAGRILLLGRTTALSGTPLANVSAAVARLVGRSADATGIQRFAYNGGQVQRSAVTKMTFTFNRAVTLDAGAFTLVGRNGAGAGTIVTWSNPAGDQQTWVLAFSGPPVVAGGLADGIYDLHLVASRVHAVAAGVPAIGGDYRFAFHRLFGDSDGDGDVDAIDLLNLRSTINKYSYESGFNAAFDHNGDGAVDNADLLQLRTRLTRQYKGYF